MRRFAERGRRVDFAKATFVSRRPIRKALLFAGLAASFASTARPAEAGPVFDLLESTYLVGVHEGSRLSDVPFRASTESYELSDGTRVDLEKWYGRKSVDMRFDFLTQTGPKSGILWGFGTGERGKKYKIEPAFRVGLIAIAQPTPMLTFSLSLTTTLGGRLRERTCTADYGPIGGVQVVNCRLAASTLEPAETLKYLWRAKPADHTRLGVRVQLQF